MRIPLHSADRSSSYEIPMTPMIDVVFLLLVYFVWTASFQMAEHRLPGAVSMPSEANRNASPSADPTPEADFDQIVVRIVWESDSPDWRLNGQRLAGLPAVRDALRRIAEIKSDVPVVLHPDPAVPVGSVIDTYDAARQAGFTRVRFAASAAREPTP